MKKTTMKQLAIEAQAAPKFVIYTDEFNCDLFIADPAKNVGPITDVIEEAYQYAIGFDNQGLKLKHWSFESGYKKLRAVPVADFKPFVKA